VPCGIVDAERGALTITFGSSSKPSDCIVETIAAKWAALHEQEQADTRLLQLTMDNGPESSGRRTPLLSRMVPLADGINKPMQRRYCRPSHSKYHPIERCWGLVELPWHGAQVVDWEGVLVWVRLWCW